MHILVWNMRKYRRMTLVGLAEKSGISKTTLNNIENEKVWPTILQLEQIAQGPCMYTLTIYLFTVPLNIRV